MHAPASRPGIKYYHIHARSTYVLGTYASPGIIYLLSRELPTIIVVHLHSIRLVSLSCTEMHDNTLTDLLTTYRAYEYIHIPTIVQWM